MFRGFLTELLLQLDRDQTKQAVKEEEHLHDVSSFMTLAAWDYSSSSLRRLVSAGDHLDLTVAGVVVFATSRGSFSFPLGFFFLIGGRVWIRDGGRSGSYTESWQ